MKSKIKILLVITFLSIKLLFAQKVEKKFVTIDKVKIAYKTFGLETRKGKEPVLVFESGMGGGDSTNLQPRKYCPFGYVVVGCVSCPLYFSSMPLMAREVSVTSILLPPLPIAV